MTTRLFPPHIRNVDEAIDYLPVWAERLGVEVLDGIDVEGDSSAAGVDLQAEVRPFRVGFGGAATVLTVRMRFDENLVGQSYASISA